MCLTGEYQASKLIIQQIWAVRRIVRMMKSVKEQKSREICNAVTNKYD